MGWLPGGTVRGLWAVPEGWVPQSDVPGDALRVNGLLGDPVGGGAMRLLLRLRRGNNIVAVHDVLHEFSVGALPHNGSNGFRRGAAAGVAWRLDVRLDDHGLRLGWVLTVRGDPDHAGPDGSADAWDAVWVQDLAVASEAATRNNEKYVGQYLDLRLGDDPQAPNAGPVLFARQGLPQPGGTHPAVVVAGTRIASAMTDLLDFFGTDFKATGVAAHAQTPTLPRGVRQHETPAAILQSRLERLHDQPTSTAFGLSLLPDHAAATGPDDLPEARRLRDWLRTLPQGNRIAETRTGPIGDHSSVRCVASDPPTEAQLIAWFGDSDGWRHVERDADGGLLSFFYGDPRNNRHVATAAKDNTLRRGHGHILRTGRTFLPNDRSLCCTAYMHGVFGSQLTVGNTTFGQLCSVVRDPVNFNAAAGLRVLIDFGDGFVQLTQAAAFEMAPGWCRWWYVLGGRVLRVAAAASPGAPTLRYEASMVQGEPVRWAVRQHVSIGDAEDGNATQVVWKAGTGTVTATAAVDGEPPWIAREFPGLACRWAFDEPLNLSSFAAADFGSYWTVESVAATALAWTISASPDAEGMPGIG